MKSSSGEGSYHDGACAMSLAVEPLKAASVRPLLLATGGTGLRNSDLSQSVPFPGGCASALSLVVSKLHPKI